MHLNKITTFLETSHYEMKLNNNVSSIFHDNKKIFLTNSHIIRRKCHLPITADLHQYICDEIKLMFIINTGYLSQGTINNRVIII